MPTDENNGVNPQNQQVNPTVSDSDDFDFNFDDSNNNQDTQAGTGLSGDMQDQMRRQGRSGMFLTPDEAITKSNEDSDMSLGNIDISSTVQPQQRSGMFLTPDEEANKEESQIEGKQYSFQGVDESQGVNDTDSDDSYLAGIDPEDVEDSQDGGFDNGQQETPVQDNDYSQDKLDDEIEDLISFGDEQKAGNVDQGSSVVDQTVAQPEDVNKEVEIQATPSVETAVEQPVDAVVQPEQGVESVELKNEEQNNGLIQNIQEGQDFQIVQDGVGNIGVENSNVDGEVITESKGGDSEDRLSQEDKKVEESFGPIPESNSPDVDMSPENVGQNVENLISSSVNTVAQTNDSNIFGNVNSDVNSDVNAKPLEQNELHIENMGTDVVENGNGDLISDVGGMQQMNQENTYVPNEAEFNQMSNLLDSSNSGQIDLSNLDSEQGLVGQNQSVQNVVPENNLQNLGTETAQMENSMDNNVPIVQNNVVQSNLENNVNEELSRFDSVESQNLQQEVPQEVKQETPQVIQQETSQNVAVNSNSSEINLDSLVSEIEPVNQNVVLNNDVSNGTLIGAVNDLVSVQQSNPATPQKKRKKQSGFKVLFIFFGVCVLLGVGVYVASKMFPEEFSKIFNKNDPVIGYLLGDNEVNVDENNPDENNPDENNPDENNIDVVDEINIENSGDNVQEQETDPNSLAGLLEGDGDGEENQNLENSGDIENNIGSGDENGVGEVSGESNESGDNTIGGDNGTGNFDPFAGIDEILGEAQEYVDKLNAYAASGQYYLDWGESNGKPVVANVGRSIQNTAQGELTKLENGEEIDTNVFDRMDDLLKKLSDLAK